MTPEQHCQRIRQLKLQLEIADYGLAMPRDNERVLELRAALDEAKAQACAAAFAPLAKWKGRAS